ncbi:DUF2924 domain-containing protein [Aestuariivirga litoralis]|uniref:DUF2924 domain-containing protein n=1 Tax=Aestuariivirga litoralis TaxID=2650924 RepID=A0A2W2AKG4_9HYPH|nr:DUF2924 domain-containing protein [Aestuariivirga litoralis]PZF75821.1 DUF2924 domain-containing protein [Aestuariivirga litoralis]
MSRTEELLAELAGMDLKSLRVEWKRLSDDDAPPAMSKELLRLAIAYRRQEQEFGGFSRRTSIRLRALRSGGRGSLQLSGETLPLKPGVMLLREWQGKAHEVLALEDGRFAYGGKVWRSLSEIAREITGVRWSGPRFFGTRDRKRTTSNG